MAFSATAVANDFLKIARDKGEALTSMKLQKLVYYAHGWTLALVGTPLISDRIEAWDYGPVIPRLYHDFKKYGNDAITEPARMWAIQGSTIPTLEDSATGTELDDAKKIINRVWEIYGGFTAARLSNSTHAPGTPWAQVYKPGEKSILIPNPIIETYFKGLLHAQ